MLTRDWVVDAAGNHVLRVRNGEPKPNRAGDTHVTLVPSDDADRVATVRWLLEQYATTDIGLRTLAYQLTERGVNGPRGGQFQPNTLSAILKNEAHIGTFTYAKRVEGKFYCISGSEVRERDSADYRRARVRMNDDSQVVRVPDARTAAGTAQSMTNASRNWFSDALETKC